MSFTNKLRRLKSFWKISWKWQIFETFSVIDLRFSFSGQNSKIVSFTNFPKAKKRFFLQRQTTNFAWTSLSKTGSNQEYFKKRLEVGKNTSCQQNDDFCTFLTYQSMFLPKNLIFCGLHRRDFNLHLRGI